ncbi:hypothetical protein [Chitinophaga vietnamensis]|uniref:hypothetical protein n=1 Tax=Chitinophaga vietnamensis TaxID=2593957 RepID=UPI0011786983|nr:hypothetical protein [Chitinophaga vietnamensis]
MKFIPQTAAALLLASFSLTASAQKIKLQSGDPAPLKNEKKINVEFTYDHLSVGKFDNEEDYIKKKTEEYNKKESGKGDEWAKAWVRDRETRYAPKFDSLFSDNSDMKAGAFKDAKYTLIFHTTFVEPGFNVGVMRKNAYIDAEVTIVESANRNNVIAKISIDNAPGRMFGGFDFDTGDRIAEAYAVSGKKLARFIAK